MQSGMLDFTTEPYTQTTATLKDLLRELNQEEGRTQGNLLDNKDLKTVAKYLHKLTGVSFVSINKHHPIKDIKTFKTLYKENKKLKGNLFSFLSEPNSHKFKIDELKIAEEEDNDHNKSKNNIIKQLCIESKIPLETIREAQQSPDIILGKIDNYLLDRIHFHSDKFIQADNHIIATLEKLHQETTKKPKKINVYEAVLISTLCLNIKHQIHFEISSFSELEEITKSSQFNIDHTNQLTNTINKDFNDEIDPLKTIIKNKNIISFFTKYNKELANVVSKITNHRIKSDCITKDLPAAQKVLKIAYFVDKKPNGKVNIKDVSIFDVVSALCAINIQRKTKIKVNRQTANTNNKHLCPRKNLDIYLNDDEIDTPFTVTHIYRNLFWSFMSRTNNTHENYESEQQRYFKKNLLHQEILQLGNIECILENLNDSIYKLADETYKFSLANNFAEIKYQRQNNAHDHELAH